MELNNKKPRTIYTKNVNGLIVVIKSNGDGTIVYTSLYNNLSTYQKMITLSHASYHVGAMRYELQDEFNDE